MCPTLRLSLLLAIAVPILGFNPGNRVATFATFGNAQTKELIKAWQPKPLAVPEGSVLLPSQETNMKRCAQTRQLEAPTSSASSRAARGPLTPPPRGG